MIEKLKYNVALQELSCLHTTLDLQNFILLRQGTDPLSSSCGSLVDMTGVPGKSVTCRVNTIPGKAPVKNELSLNYTHICYETLMFVQRRHVGGWTKIKMLDSA